MGLWREGSSWGAGMRVNARAAAAGMDALRQALAGAQPGDEVVLGAGDFALDAALHLPEGITLRGAGRQATRFLHGSDGSAASPHSPGLKRRASTKC